MSQEIIDVKKDGRSCYPIYLCDSFGCLRRDVRELSPASRKICIVTDSNVSGLYLEEVSALLGEEFASAVCFVFPAGEDHKNLDTVKSLYEFLIQHSFDRNDMLAALGGGVCGDLTGFAAATYLRGIDFIQIPTTLLSQVDSSIGGKTGVDFDEYKNMVGAFYMPKLVYINVSVLRTLPEDQFASGMGEVIKHGCIRSASYLDWIEENKALIKDLDLEAMQHMVRESCLIKKAVVEEDPTEKGIRATLNFGHTLGHAIEKEMHFTLTHGACVALGCRAAMYISCRRGLISAADVRNTGDLFSYFGLHEYFHPDDPDKIIDSVKHDKKMDSGVIRFILLNGMGNAFIDRTVSADDMREALAFLTGDDSHEQR